MKRYLPPVTTLALLWTMATVAAAVAAQRVLHVSMNAAGAGSGGSWADAYTNLQPALAAATSGDEIWVRAGAYYPAGLAGSRAATFQLKTGVRLYGGFAGGENTREERDVLRNETLLSGDLSRNDQPNFVSYTENSYHVVTGSGTDASALLDGFVIQAGNASGSTITYNSGAGLKIDHGSPTIANCVFRANLGKVAGALLNLASSPMLTNCVFSNNIAQSTFARGGAIYNASGSAPVIVDCSFLANVAAGGPNPIDGGAMFLDANCPATISRCSFAGNRSTTSGGAIGNFSGGVIFEQCAFWNNSSGAGGAVWNGGTNFLFINCAFGGNLAAAGGAVFNLSSTGTLTGCTLAANVANEGGGLANDLNSRVQIRNSILWANVGTNSATDLREQVSNAGGASSSVSFSCVQGLFVPQPDEPPPGPTSFPGSTDADPLFVDVSQQRLHLRLASPCIDAGDNTALPAGVLRDLDRRARFVNEPWTSDTGAGATPLVDMGAYEYQGVVPEQVSEPIAGRETVGGGENFTLMYRRDRNLTDVTVTAESSLEASTALWGPSGLEFNEVSQDTTHTTLKASAPTNAQPGRFFRLKVTRP